ncbi:MAG: hypothetical protein ACXAB5_08175, partial [Candidatus Thorarchaeota archaeon]
NLEYEWYESSYQSHAAEINSCLICVAIKRKRYDYIRKVGDEMVGVSVDGSYIISDGSYGIPYYSLTPNYLLSF